MLNGIQLMDHLAIGHVSTNWLPDMSVNQMPSVQCFCANQISLAHLPKLRTISTMNYVRIIFNFLNSEQVKVRYSDVFALQMFAIHIPTVCSLILSVEAYL